ncbi:MAG TPA: cytochrome c-type biogenesis protein CcmH [Candidatus Acidoferrum sp.]|nr:cytochrome c-type biogenesis protein CcmH [Candidatus Acidoferrum sp.]
MIKARKIAWMVVVCAIVAAPFAASHLLAQQESERVKKIGGKFMCMCGCNEVLTQCNHVGCQTSKAMLKEIDDAVSQGKSETQITQMLVQEYGTAVYAEPPKSGFSLVAWSMPTVYLLLGLGLVVFVISRWRKRGVPAAAGPAKGPAVSAELLERARAQAAKETDD